MVATKLDTPKSDYRERTGTEWLVLGLLGVRASVSVRVSVSGVLVLELVIGVSFSVNSNSSPNPKTNHSVPVLSR